MPPFTNPLIVSESPGVFFYQCCIAGIMLETVAPSKSVKSWWEFNYWGIDVSYQIARCSLWRNQYYKFILN